MVSSCMPKICISQSKQKKYPFGDIPNLAEFAKEQGVTYADVKRFNPWLRDRKLNTLGKTYKILIPEAEDMYYKKANTCVHDSRWIVK